MGDRPNIHNKRAYYQIRSDHMPLPKDTKYNYQDLLNWNGPERYELIEGVPVLLASPSRVHQEILTELVRQIANYLDGKSCRVYPAPFSVRLFASQEDSNDDVTTVVEPDISVICDPGKLDDFGCVGAPDLVLEILSPSTARYDRLEKLRLYQQAGVKEYWIVNPADQSVLVLLLDDSGQYRIHEVYTKDSEAKIHVLNDCRIYLDRVFSN